MQKPMERRETMKQDVEHVKDKDPILHIHSPSVFVIIFWNLPDGQVY